CCQVFVNLKPCNGRQCCTSILHMRWRFCKSIGVAAAALSLSLCAAETEKGEDDQIEIVGLRSPSVPRLPRTGNAAERIAKFEAFKALGSSNLAQRKIALEQVKQDPG